MFDLSGKVALVTGASGSLGSAIAKALHANGAIVALHGTRVPALEALQQELGERAHVFPCNLSDREARAKLVPTVIEALGQIDILVNNAGITRDGLAMRMKNEDWDAVVDINLNAPFELARACLRGMMKARFGRIIGITSVAGVVGNAGQANYAATKAGLIGMSKALAQEVGSRGITVNCVAPGLIDSAMNDKLNDKQRETILAAVPVGRLGAPEEIAAAVVYLASNEASYVTGETIQINGGMAMV
ncbi:MAG: 3-oxoacyl-[acyl-carrier-protein] reductase [Rhizobiales bacterium]|nr:3-oxoacyl-[acyl-carrier-protein] reductase [Hyphomicrobiales bacterium]